MHALFQSQVSISEDDSSSLTSLTTTPKHDTLLPGELPKPVTGLDKPTTPDTTTKRPKETEFHATKKTSTTITTSKTELQV